LIAITRSIDRVLRAKHYWIPNWYRPDHWVAHWDLFAWTEKKPDYAFTPETTWWFDRDKATAIGMAG
jgi:microcin C transport system substrate-binding protein